MAFHPCSGLGLFFVLSAILLLIFAEIGQTSTHQVQRQIRIVSLNTNGFGVALAAATGSPGANLTDLYAPPGVNPAGNGEGIANNYEWGLWSYCEGKGGLGSLKPVCIPTKKQLGHQFQPLTALLSDVPPKYQSSVQKVLPPTTFTSTSYLSNLSRIAFYFIFTGAIVAGLGLFMGLLVYRLAYLFVALLVLVAAVLVAIGAVVYTVIIGKVKGGITGLGVDGSVPLGLVIEYGNGLWLIWGAVGSLFLAVVPFFLACCTGRNRANY